MGKVFVTGGDGCIGAWVVRHLLDAGDEVVLFDVDRPAATDFSTGSTRWRTNRPRRSTPPTTGCHRWAFGPTPSYGPGRDQGLTSQPTLAIEHAVRHQPYNVDYGGTLDFQYAPDVARLFIAASASEPAGAEVLNVEGHVVPVAAEDRKRLAQPD